MNWVCHRQRAGYRRVGVPDRLASTAGRAVRRVRRVWLVAGVVLVRMAVQWPMLCASAAQASHAQFAG